LLLPLPPHTGNTAIGSAAQINDDEGGGMELALAFAAAAESAGEKIVLLDCTRLALSNGGQAK
jgi:hypothetical protein